MGVTGRVVALRCLARAQGQASMTVGCVSSVLLLLHAWLRADLLTVFYSRHHAPLQTHCLTLGQTQHHSADPSPCETLPGMLRAHRHRAVLYDVRVKPLYHVQYNPLYHAHTLQQSA